MNYFTTYQSCDGDIVLMSNNLMCKVVDTAIVSLKMSDGIIRDLILVRNILELKET